MVSVDVCETFFVYKRWCSLVCTNSAASCLCSIHCRHVDGLQEILDAGVEYVKIFTEGHIVPSADVQNQ